MSDTPVTQAPYSSRVEGPQGEVIMGVSGTGERPTCGAITTPKRHAMTPQEALLVGAWVERRRAIDAEGNVLVAAAQKRLGFQGRLSCDVEKAEWVEVQES